MFFILPDCLPNIWYIFAQDKKFFQYKNFYVKKIKQIYNINRTECHTINNIRSNTLKLYLPMQYVYIIDYQ